ncbi:MAG: M23 family metallopeptidase [Desulfovibrio sp.]|jgi:murein DD-endopeptidase MepM/ murein hydrolase activator NlpD|nr:M23 family metallopeptidase [Desulfovibrio sp.]
MLIPKLKDKKKFAILIAVVLLVACATLFANLTSKTEAPVPPPTVDSKTGAPVPPPAVDSETAEKEADENKAGKDADWFEGERAEAEKEETPEEEEEKIVQGEIARGDTMGGLLRQWLSPAQVQSLLAACKDVYSVGRIRAGQPYLVLLEQGDLARFEYETDDTHRLVITREIIGETSRWKASLEKIAYSVTQVKVEGTINSNLFDTMTQLGESPALAMRLADIFAWEINFIRDIQPGDSFKLLVEKRYRDGMFKGYGHIPVAEFINKKNRFEAFLFMDSYGNNAFFNSSGESLRRAFLKAPLAFTRVSSRYSHARLHPILNTVRPHLGVDYAAPAGTPVRAIGSGTVTFKGYGHGAGNYITLKHPNGYESMYMHLSGFARGLKQGGRVRQGETIGYVGSTGYATGPHLDFRLKRNGRFLNPEKVLSPRDESVPAAKVAEFRNIRDMRRALLEAGVEGGETQAELEKTPGENTK